MPTLHRSDHAKGIEPTPYPDCAGQLVAVRTTFSFPAAIAAGDIVEMAVLPPNCRIVDAILDSDDLDSDGTPAITLDVGVMSGEAGKDDSARTCGAELFDDSTVAQAGGLARPTLKTAVRIAPTNEQRGIGIKVATVADVGVVGTVGLTLFYTA